MVVEKVEKDKLEEEGKVEEETRSMESRVMIGLESSERYYYHTKTPTNALTLKAWACSFQHHQHHH